MNNLRKWNDALEAVSKGNLGLSPTGWVRLYSAISEHVLHLEDVSPDVTVQNEGSIFIFYLESAEARAWVRDNVDTDGAQWWAGNGLVVEHRHADNLASGLLSHGLEVV